MKPDRTVYKYPLAMHTGPQSVTVPAENDFRLFDFQGRIPCVWLEVIPSHLVMDKSYRIMATGQELNLEGSILNWKASCQILTKTGLEVWHLYEEFEK